MSNSVDQPVEQLSRVEQLPEFDRAIIRTKETLVSFRDGSYKKVKHTEWKHSQWIHFTKSNGKEVHVNPDNVNYLEDL